MQQTVTAFETVPAELTLKQPEMAFYISQCYDLQFSHVAIFWLLLPQYNGNI